MTHIRMTDRRIALAALFAGLLVSTPAAAAGPDGDTPPVADASVANDDAGKPTAAKTCRRIAVTGSRVKKLRVCMTANEWKSQNENGNRTARDVIDSSAKSVVTSG